VNNPLFYFLNNASPQSVTGGLVFPHVPRTTVWDIIEHVQDYLGADPSATTSRVAHRSIQAALRELVNSHQWLYYYTHGRIQGHGFYTTGTVQFQVSSGSVPNLVTLTGGTWPSWANYASIRFGFPTGVTTGPISNATNASPIVITSTGHGLITGASIAVSGVNGNTAANGTWIITTIDANTFSLNGSVGNGTYTSGGTWSSTGPSNIGVVIYDVDRVIDSTHLTLVSSLAPETDIPTGQSFVLYQDTYDLPTDFINTDQGFADVSWGGMEYVHPNRWLQVNRYYQSYSNTPRFYTIMGSPKSPNRMCWRIFPFPDSDRTLDFVYKRRPRLPTLDQYTTGLVITDPVGGPQTIYGNGTNWTSSMVGSIIRLSGDSVTLPTGWAGANPYVMERNIVQVISPTQLTVDDVATTAYQNVAFRISDPIDVEETAMLEAYYRCVEKHAAMMRNMKDAPLRASLYEDALLYAKDADARSFATRQAGVGGPYRQRLANMPRGPDVS